MCFPGLRSTRLRCLVSFSSRSYTSEPAGIPVDAHLTIWFLNENKPSLQRSLQRRSMRLRAGYGRQLFVTKIISQSNRGRPQVSHQPISERKYVLDSDSPGDGILTRSSGGLTVSKVFRHETDVGILGQDTCSVSSISVSGRKHFFNPTPIDSPVHRSALQSE